MLLCYSLLNCCAWVGGGAEISLNSGLFITAPALWYIPYHLNITVRFQLEGCSTEDLLQDTSTKVRLILAYMVSLIVTMSNQHLKYSLKSVVLFHKLPYYARHLHIKLLATLHHKCLMITQALSLKNLLPYIIPTMRILELHELHRQLLSTHLAGLGEAARPWPDQCMPGKNKFQIVYAIINYRCMTLIMLALKQKAVSVHWVVTCSCDVR